MKILNSGRGCHQNYSSQGCGPALLKFRHSEASADSADAVAEQPEGLVAKP